jgi:undecaprenyl diphosphate synthase
LFFKKSSVKLIIPKHVAIIMDGNGRWAKKRGLPRSAGHAQGVKALKNIIEPAGKLGIRYLSVYAFSTENWKRPQDEIETLMNLLLENINKELPEIKEKKIRLRFLGDLKALSESLQKSIQQAEEQTAQNSAMQINIMLNYGARREMIQAIHQAAQSGADLKTIKEEEFEKFLYTRDIPDPELLIRTSGELRVSNFLLWQIAYTEIYITPTLWPDFNEAELKKAIENYSQRERRLGHVQAAAH